MKTESTTEVELRQFGAAYQYDVTYLLDLLQASPEVFSRFAACQGLGQHREALSLEAHFVARITTMQIEDCGPCAQLNLRMAVESGVGREELRTLLERPEDLPAPLGAVRDHVRRALGAEPEDLEASEALRASLGDKAFAELAAAIVGSRLYPTLKKALSSSRACAPLHLDF